MASIEAARSHCRMQSKLPSARTRLCTPFYSRTRRDTATEEATAVRTAAEWAEAEWVAVAWAEAGITVTRKNRARMEKKFSKKCPRKLADDFLTSPKRSRSIRFIRTSTKNCAASTAWATFPRKRMQRRDITK